jgi:hypothetical protein
MRNKQNATRAVSFHLFDFSPLTGQSDTVRVPRRPSSRRGRAPMDFALVNE